MENYFALYDLPVSFTVDAAALRRRFLEQSRAAHPDRFIGADEAEQAEALRLSAVNNEAYKTLGNDDRRMAYILKLEGALDEEEKYTLPPAFLMEMMDLNDLISEYEMAPDGSNKEAAINALEAAFDSWQSATAPLMRGFDAGDRSPTLLAQLKDFYFRRKYLLRIQDRLNTFAS